VNSPKPLKRFNPYEVKEDWGTSFPRNHPCYEISYILIEDPVLSNLREPRNMGGYERIHLKFNEFLVTWVFTRFREGGFPNPDRDIHLTERRNYLRYEIFYGVDPTPSPSRTMKTTNEITDMDVSPPASPKPVPRRSLTDLPLEILFDISADLVFSTPGQLRLDYWRSFILVCHQSSATLQNFGLWTRMCIKKFGRRAKTDLEVFTRCFKHNGGGSARIQQKHGFSMPDVARLVFARLYFEESRWALGQTCESKKPYLILAKHLDGIRNVLGRRLSPIYPDTEADVEGLLTGNPSVEGESSPPRDGILWFKTGKDLYKKPITSSINRKRKKVGGVTELTTDFANIFAIEPFPFSISGPGKISIDMGVTEIAQIHRIALILTDPHHPDNQVAWEFVKAKDNHPLRRSRVAGYLKYRYLDLPDDYVLMRAQIMFGSIINDLDLSMEMNAATERLIDNYRVIIVRTAWEVYCEVLHVFQIDFAISSFIMAHGWLHTLLSMFSLHLLSPTCTRSNHKGGLEGKGHQTLLAEVIKIRPENAPRWLEAICSAVQQMSRSPSNLTSLMQQVCLGISCSTNDSYNFLKSVFNLPSFLISRHGNGNGNGAWGCDALDPFLRRGCFPRYYPRKVKNGRYNQPPFTLLGRICSVGKAGGQITNFTATQPLKSEYPRILIHTLVALQDGVHGDPEWSSACLQKVISYLPEYHTDPTAPLSIPIRDYLDVIELDNYWTTTVDVKNEVSDMSSILGSDGEVETGDESEDGVGSGDEDGEGNQKPSATPDQSFAPEHATLNDLIFCQMLYHDPGFSRRTHEPYKGDPWKFLEAFLKVTSTPFDLKEPPMDGGGERRDTRYFHKLTVERIAVLLGFFNKPRGLSKFAFLCFDSSPQDSKLTRMSPWGLKAFLQQMRKVGSSLSPLGPKPFIPPDIRGSPIDWMPNTKPVSRASTDLTIPVLLENGD